MQIINYLNYKHLIMQVLCLCLCVYVCLPICSNIPNRSTFVCPFCGARNLDQQELVKHCMDNHRNDPNKVVRDYSVMH